MGLARIRLIVSAQPPHKPGRPDLAPAAHRVAMCRAAVGGDPGFVVDDRETRRDGPSYTFDTALELLAEFDAAQPVRWLVGADLLAGLPNWHRAPELLAGDRVQFMVMRRPGWTIDWPALPREVRALRDHVVEVPQVDIRATDLRARVAAGRSLAYLTPPGVIAHIEAARLYR